MCHFTRQCRHSGPALPPRRLQVRRMRDSFLNRFTTTYSLRPIADVGSVFRRYPGMWQVGAVWNHGCCVGEVCAV